MNPALMFVGAMVVLEAGASIAYFFRNDWQHGTYWCLCTALTIVVSFMGDKL